MRLEHDINPQKNELTQADISRIRQLLDTVNTVLKEVIDSTFPDLISSINASHKMNRLIRNEKGEIISFLVCEDMGNGELYIKYAFSEKGSIKNFGQEVVKFINKAKKEGYRSISFNGFNDSLNKFLERFGFVLTDGQYAPFYELSLENDPAVKKFEVFRKLAKAVKFLEEDNNAKEVWMHLRPENKKKIKQLLAVAISQNKDLKLNFLYGAINTLIKNNIDIQSLKSLNDLYERSRIAGSAAEKIEKAAKYTDALVSYIHKNYGLELSLEIINSIQTVLSKSNSSNWDKEIKNILSSANIVIDVSVTETFLYGLNEEEPITKIGSFVFGGASYDIVTLNNKEEMKKESATLGHCVGDSDFYIEKVKNGDIKVISLRVAGVPKWTIEYNLKDKNIYQFKGGDDVPVNSLPENKGLVLNTLQAMSSGGCEVFGISEDFDYCIYLDTKEGEYCSAHNEDIREKSRNKEIRILKGEIKVDNTFDKEEVLRLCNIEGLTLDLTNCRQEIKDEITEVEGSIIDNSEFVKYDKLTKVGKSLNARYGTSLNLPALTKVGKSLNARSATSLNLPVLTTVGESLNARSATSLNLPALTTVQADLDASSAISLSLPVLATVQGDLYVISAISLNLPNLTTIGEILYASSAISLNLPVLTKIGLSLHASSATSLNLPALIELKRLYVSSTLQSIMTRPELTVKDQIFYYKGTVDSNDKMEFSTIEGFREYLKI